MVKFKELGFGNFEEYENYFFNTLLPPDRERHLRNLLLTYPQVVEVVPLLIAERLKNGEIDIFDPSIEELVTYEFKCSRVNEENITQITKFCRRSGILDLFQEIRDIHDYLLGIEVGLDTNARKNRRYPIIEK